VNPIPEENSDKSHPGSVSPSADRSGFADAESPVPPPRLCLRRSLPSQSDVAVLKARQRNAEKLRSPALSGDAAPNSRPEKSPAAFPPRP